MMRGRWRMTWHENGGISPGVPDLSFVMLGGGHYETGWMELKAERLKSPPLAHPQQTFTLTIEPSQITWFESHEGLVPAIFLIALNDVWFVVTGRHVQTLAQKMNVTQLCQIAWWYGPAQDEDLPRLLQAMTLRGR
jgi:hypothetical protein